MKRNPLFRFWLLILFLVLLLGSSPVQAGGSSQDSALTATITIPPAATLVGPTFVIPQTGGETAYGDFFSSWTLWVVLGLLLVVLVMGPRGPVDPGHHEITEFSPSQTGRLILAAQFSGLHNGLVKRFFTKGVNDGT